MNTVSLVVNIVLTVSVLGLAFLVLGVLRSLGVMSWRLEQMEATTPRRIGRDGVPVGRKAPDFTLPTAAGGEVSLRDYAGRKVLLVFTQTGCGPCEGIVPELNRVHRYGDPPVVIINNGKSDEARAWAKDVKAECPVLLQENLSVSKQYEVFATPFAFLIDAQEVVTSKGTVGTRQHLTFVLTGAGQRKQHHVDAPTAAGERGPSMQTHTSKEAAHV